MEQYIVTGMSCAACSARVEKAVSSVEGVTSCSVSLLTNSMGVEGTAAPSEIIAAVRNAGYGAEKKERGTESSSGAEKYDDMLKDRETPAMKRRLIASLCLLVPLLYLSMGHMMWGWPLPAAVSDDYFAHGLFQLLATTAIMVINQKFFVNGWKGVIHRSPNMDTLVALGAGASYGYSVYALFAMSDAWMKMDMHRAMSWMHEFYFESAAMILTLVTLGKMLEAHSKGKTTDALKGLMRLAPKTAVVLRGGEEIIVDISQVQIGDLFVVRPGENIPVDGKVVEGSSAVNEAALTGESIPVDKAAGDMVSAATTNQSGFLKCEAVRVGEDTTLSQIIRMVSDAAATKAPIAKIADKVSGVFVPVVIVIAVATALIWMLAGQEAGFALARGISVLVISCPCALGLATPVAIMVGNGMGAKNGILFKTALSLEEAGKTRIVALDKTGTITEGEPHVTDIFPAEGVTENELLEAAYALEQQSEHPLAKAVISLGKARQVDVPAVTQFASVPGNGLCGVWNGRQLAGGNLNFIEKKAAITEEVKRQAETLAEQGKTALFFVSGKKQLGMIAAADVVKEDSQRAVRELQDMDIRVVMLTGDNERTAKAISAQIGVDEVIAGVLPDGKETVIRNLQKQGRVAMVGDGINDAPALTRADIGIAIGAGTDIAVDAADIVLMKSRLFDVPSAIRLSRNVIRNIKENLFWAFIYNVIGIPLAAGALYPRFGVLLNPMIAAAAMSLSSVCVVSNALRLRRFRVGKKDQGNGAGEETQERLAEMPRKDGEEGRSGETLSAMSRKDIAEVEINKNEQLKTADKPELQSGQADEPERKLKMEKTLLIEGMMCEHCKKHVEDALNAMDGVTASVDLENNCAKVTMEQEIAMEEFDKVITKAGYTLKSA